MTGWETIVAAVGSLLLGLLLGFVAGRSRVAALERRFRQLEVRVRATVIPVLERRAETLAIPRKDRGHDEDGPIDAAIALAGAVDKQESLATLPFSDTLQIQASELRKKQSAGE